jgi:ATP-dependent exoDNAse (exonuclease V) alpha subunit
MADALNRRLHDTLAASGPSVIAARDHHIRVGDLIISRANDATIELRPNPRHTTDRVDQVRNGNRWRVAAVDPATKRLAAERLTDGARTVFSGDYLTEHVTLGYATTVHAAQGVTADSCHALVGEGASRAMLYVAMTRGRPPAPAVPWFPGARSTRAAGAPSAAGPPDLRRHVGRF